MARCDQLPVGTVGVRLNLLVRECQANGSDALADISQGAGFQVWLLSPSGVVKTRNGTLTTDGTDGLFGYTLQGGDIDEAGTWTVQGCLELPSGTGPFVTSTSTFVAFYGVKANQLVSPGLAPIDFVGVGLGVLS